MNQARRSFSSSGWQRLGLVLVGAVIWISFLDFPQPVREGADPSWQAALVDAHLHGRQFGQDVIFTYGPWGWLTSSYFSPGVPVGKWIWELGGKLLLAAGMVRLSLELPAIRRWWFLLALPLFGPLYPDVLPMLGITLAVPIWLFRGETPSWLKGLTLVALALFAHIKFTYALLATVGVGLAALSWFWRGSWQRGTALVLGLGIACLGWWLAAGQKLAQLPAYWRYSWEISRGYAGAMSFGEPWKVFFMGALVTVISLIYVCSAGWAHPDRRFGWPAACFLGAAWFLAWKHGFTRADQHVLGFFGFGLLTALATPAMLPSRTRCRWYGVCPLLCLLGLEIFYGKAYAASAWAPWEPLDRSFHGAVNLSHRRAEFAVALEREQRLGARPELQAAVGAGTVDLLNYDQGLLLLNRLNYQPRPILQSYSAYTPALLRKNLEFYRSAAAPDYVVVKIQGFEGHNPLQEDSLVLAELPRRYDVALVTDGYVLLRKKPTPPVEAEFTRQVLFDRDAGLDDIARLAITARPSPLASALASAVVHLPFVRTFLQGAGGLLGADG